MPGVRQKVFVLRQRGGGVYCSPACAEAAQKELEELLQSMMQEEDEDSEEGHDD